MRTCEKHAFRSLSVILMAFVLLFSTGCSAPSGAANVPTPPSTAQTQSALESENSPVQSAFSQAHTQIQHLHNEMTHLSSAPAAVSLPTSSTSVLAVGVLQESGVRLRSAPSTDSSIVTELNSGAVVAILSQEGSWYQVGYASQSGYISSELVTAHQNTEGLSGYVVTTDDLNMRSSAAADSAVVTTVPHHTYLTLLGFENGWFYVSDGSSSGYISGDYASPCLSKPDEGTGSSGSVDSSDSGSGSGSSGDTSGGGGTNSGGSSSGGSASGQAIADLAYAYLGYPYVYGAAGPDGFDCSGFIKFVFGQFGYSLPHGTNGQLGYGTPVDRSALQPGDMVFFFDPDFGSGPTTHGGIYLGGGNFIHASTNGREEVQIHNLDQDSYYSSVFTAARRLAG